MAFFNKYMNIPRAFFTYLFGRISQKSFDML